MGTSVCIFGFVLDAAMQVLTVDLIMFMIWILSFVLCAGKSVGQAGVYEVS